MDPKTLVLDISSDEDIGWGETGEVGGGDDFDWISELLEEVDRETDDSDDVVEVVLSPKQRMKSSSAALKDVDDDCVVLDGDPDKPVAIENDTMVADSDDLLVVGEKGQVACRDYPHPRHLCATFPFNSTPHESHCDQCHCYVCDSLAPCVHWVLEDVSCIDHCHATDKEEYWKIQRKCLKNSDKALLPVPIAPDTSLSTRLPQMNQNPQSTPLGPNYVPQGQVCRPTSIRACSMSATFGNPNIRNEFRSQRSGYIVPKNKFQPNLVSQPLLSTRNNIMPRDRRHSVGNLGPQFTLPHAAFKRAGSIGVPLATNRRGYNSSNNNYGSQYPRNPHPVTTPSDKNIIGWQDSCGGITPESNNYRISSQPNVGCIFANSAPSQPLVSSQPNVGSFFVNSMPSLPQECSQPNRACSFVTQPQVFSQPNAGSGCVSSVPSQPQVPSQPYVGSVYVNSVPSQPQVSSQHNVGSTFANSMPSQPQIYSQPIPVSNYCQNIFQQGNQAQCDPDPSFTDFELNWVTPTSHKDHNNQSPVAENSQLQGVAPPDGTSPVTEFDHEFTGSTNPVGPGLLDFHFDSWILDNQPVSVGLEVSVPSGLNVLSPEPALIDAGTFFDL